MSLHIVRRAIHRAGRAVAVGAALLGLPLAVHAAFPDKPVTLVIPYAPGGSTDVLARLLSEAMARDLGQPVLVENAAGAGGTLGTAKVARAAPDGHTVLFHNTGIAIAPSLYSKVPYDVMRDLEPVASAGDVPMILVRSAKFEPATLTDLIRHMKAKPGETRFAHAGVGSTSYLCALLFGRSAEVTSTMVPYRGTGPALTDLLAGNVDLTCDQPVSTSQHLASGMLKAYALAAPERIPSQPAVPTFAEAGMANFNLAVWHGFYAPRGTPQPVVERLNAAVRAALASPAVVRRLAEMGVVIPQGERLKPESLRTLTASELKSWAPILQAAGAKVE